MVRQTLILIAALPLAGCFTGHEAPVSVAQYLQWDDWARQNSAAHLQEDGRRMIRAQEQVERMLNATCVPEAALPDADELRTILQTVPEARRNDISIDTAVLDWAGREYPCAG